jgi:hypothetical protein
MRHRPVVVRQHRVGPGVVAEVMTGREDLVREMRIRRKPLADDEHRELDVRPVRGVKDRTHDGRITSDVEGQGYVLARCGTVADLSGRSARHWRSS